MRILVVDDHRELLGFVATALTRDGYDVETAATLAEATARLGEHKMDLLVLDLALPDGNGADLCRSVRERGSPLRILMLTANTEVASRVSALDAGADDYLMKPFALAELRARVRALLRRGTFASGAPAEVRWGDVCINFEARRATVGSRSAPITAREWTILDELARAEGSVSRADLLARAWPGDGAEKGASLEVLISRIRHKLGADLIETRRGVGYSLAREGDSA